MITHIMWNNTDALLVKNVCVNYALSTSLNDACESLKLAFQKQILLKCGVLKMMKLKHSTSIITSE